MHSELRQYRYLWPAIGPAEEKWQASGDGLPVLTRELPESATELAADSRWPAFFPSPICLVTTSDGTQTGLEKVVGASVVNRFPYVVALSFCVKGLSDRHYVRRTFIDLLERGGTAAVQFLPPGDSLNRAMGAIQTIPEEGTTSRIAHTGLDTRRAMGGPAPVFEDAYLVYETRLVRPGRDFEGRSIYPAPWLDVGSHRVFFLEVTAVQLRADIARGDQQIQWRSLPAWSPQDRALGLATGPSRRVGAEGRYQKGYTPNYAFPSAGTTAFEADDVVGDMAVKHLPPLAEDQVEVDNDRARWPCFFPSSVGMITTTGGNGEVNLMPCGSTTILSRHPLIVAPCVSHARINERYAPRASLGMIRRAGRFGCGVPYIDDAVLTALRYAGNTSFAADPDKVRNAGLEVSTTGAGSPWLPALPLNYDCEVVGEVNLGTHVMFLGEVRRVIRRADLAPDNPLEWCPWPGLGTPRPAAVPA